METRTFPELSVLQCGRTGKVIRMNERTNEKSQNAVEVRAVGECFQSFHE